MQALDFSRSRACLFCRMSELAIAAAMATTPTTTTSSGAPLPSPPLAPPLLRCSRLGRLGLLSLRLLGRGFWALRLQSRRGLSMPSELLRRCSGSRAGSGSLGPNRRHSPGPGWQARLAGGRQRAALVTACARPLSPEDTVQVQAARVGVSRHPRPVSRGGGRRREAGGGRARGRERGRGRGRRARGGRRQRTGERALALAPPALPLVLATSPPEDRQKLAGASFPAGIKQVMAWHRRCGCCSGRGTVAAQEFSRCRHPPEERDSLAEAPSLSRRPLPPGTQLLAPARPPPPTAPPPGCRVPAPTNTCRRSRHCPVAQSPLSFSLKEA